MNRLPLYIGLIYAQAYFENENKIESVWNGFMFASPDRDWPAMGDVEFHAVRIGLHLMQGEPLKQARLLIQIDHDNNNRTTDDMQRFHIPNLSLRAQWSLFYIINIYAPVALIRGMAFVRSRNQLRFAGALPANSGQINQSLGEDRNVNAARSARKIATPRSIRARDNLGIPATASSSSGRSASAHRASSADTPAINIDRSNHSIAEGGAQPGPSEAITRQSATPASQSPKRTFSEFEEENVNRNAPSNPNGSKLSNFVSTLESDAENKKEDNQYDLPHPSKKLKPVDVFGPDSTLYAFEGPEPDAPTHSVGSTNLSAPEPEQHGPKPNAPIDVDQLSRLPYNQSSNSKKPRTARSSVSSNHSATPYSAGIAEKVKTRSRATPSSAGPSKKVKTSSRVQKQPRATKTKKKNQPKSGNRSGKSSSKLYPKAEESLDNGSSEKDTEPKDSWEVWEKEILTDEIRKLLREYEAAGTPDNKRLHDSKLWRHLYPICHQRGLNRTAVAIGNQWKRFGRPASGLDERTEKAKAKNLLLGVSLQKPRKK